MKLTGKQLFWLKKSNIDIYNKFKTEFLFHSNKLEGSKFSKSEIMKLIADSEVTGPHELKDVIETANSIVVFDFMVETHNEKLTERLLKEFHSILFKNTLNTFADKLAGIYIDLYHLD
ncbi:hypothetical protein [Staphylococcus carnosus]|uniref:Truncated Fic protein family protein (Fragment 1) n=2 Tax=Staphylococcus carnosus TaxID=1281 RepID=B9DQ93_STACT|nr:hypothetical protein [Staphylococcus carnosus]ANZ33756.1 hypothetical protein BEK99_08115 [Staphylococcus carnosus]QPT03724.1 hypothetical protein I6G40_11705 [Staphylococcus carnosus]QQS85691.1 hypothetical protein I6J04_02525 [Staphylococcus carnosus]QRQ05628.1 hypothetical protein I6J34_02865 [Staphylococcus carnosus]UQA66448.1 hypothetical protein Sta3580_07740 [Staphylococcus carnosus]